MTKTVVQHVLGRLQELGISDVFGVPGDFAFPINDAICKDKKLRWIGSCNELNAAYSADGYARVKGFGAVCTTYGVGELSTISAIGGAYAENVPVFHLVGMPSLGTMESRGKVHHSLGNGEFGVYFKMTEPVVCARAIMTPEICLLPPHGPTKPPWMKPTRASSAFSASLTSRTANWKRMLRPLTAY